jgi:hypothetical protein
MFNVQGGLGRKMSERRWFSGLDGQIGLIHSILGVDKRVGIAWHCYVASSRAPFPFSRICKVAYGQDDLGKDLISEIFPTEWIPMISHGY